jgi:ATP-dependent Lon protease
MFVEVVSTPGKGNLVLTGQLGDVMKESAQAALTFCRAWAARQGHPEDFFARHDFHVHLPAGAIPKDGPSAGITVATAIVSVLTGRRIDRKVALTGEITLRGDILPVGGLKEKLLAARAAGIREVVLPKLNQRDLAEIPEATRKGLTLHFVDTMTEALDLALRPPASDRVAATRPRHRRPTPPTKRRADRSHR